MSTRVYAHDPDMYGRGKPRRCSGERQGAKMIKEQIEAHVANKTASTMQAAFERA